MNNFIEELKWRGLIHDFTPGIQKFLNEKFRSAYIGFDPTSDSLHIGNLVPIMLLSHFQICGHKPIALIGGATGMIGDPSGKSSERNLLNEKTLRHNENCLKKQLSSFLSFDKNSENSAILLNNYDWMKNFSFLKFIRDVGKHITVNYMMSKDSVKNRISSESGNGMSFTEFTYQMVQGFDFLFLNRNHNCSIQMGGSDQWGNITTGTELIRRIDKGKGYAITCPLITKSDGSKFGKSEGGNIWLDSEKTSVYKFYQYWLNTSDEDAKVYIKIFTFLEKNIIEQLIVDHEASPHLRILQKKLASEITRIVHNEEELNNAVKASGILFSKDFINEINEIDENIFLDIFEGVQTCELSLDQIEKGINIVKSLSEISGFLSSNSEARRALKENSISVNKNKVSETYTLTTGDLIRNKYIILNRGKKKTFILKIK
ncbi:MAG: tyrosine--tRNA ligase [Flavobacteriaceae bacterium]|nr:tyrosine--tRNA ligase [Flavobacteriaceae bacterium]|tara:strand:+ start:26572 stop:27864 length:1293 start_codon:yes stop_codon:yes gene_type:complete